jgi:hypothetical protein
VGEQAGREDHSMHKAKARKAERGLTTNREKAKATKPFMMIKHSATVRKKGLRSLREKQVRAPFSSILTHLVALC